MHVLFVFVALVAAVAGELAYIEDLNDDHMTRNLHMGLPETLNFNLRHTGGNLELNLKETKHLRRTVPMLVAEGDEITRFESKPNSRTRFYQDKRNGAYFVAECEAGEHGPCTRKLTGNVHIDGIEYKLEPSAVDARSFNVHFGAPHSLEKLNRRTFQSGTIGDHSVTLMGNDAVPHPGMANQGKAEEELAKKRNALLDDLVERLEHLKSTKKRSAPTTHAVEMLLAIDHFMYNKFGNIYSTDEDIMAAIRKFFSHIINGVDLKYASIQDPDVSFYVTFAGFYVAKNETASTVWMDYSGGRPDCLDGLQNMRTWREKTDIGIPEHDHAALISGTNVWYGSSSGVAGVAYLNGVCNSYRVSVNEDWNFFEGAHILAHELGHNLGAPHDSGASGTECDANLKYVMAPYVVSVSSSSTNTEPWQFSPCSIESFKNYVNGMGTGSCTLDSPDIYDENEFNDFTDELGGVEYTGDEQCEVILGKGATQCTSTANTAQVCRDFQCKLPSSGCSRHVALEGTPCGEGMMCFEGLCQPVECKGRQCGVTTPVTDSTSTAASSTTDMPTTTSGGFQCLDRGRGGYDCPGLTALYGSKAKMCGVFARDCCVSCTQKSICKKEKTVKLGKKKMSCTALVGDIGFDAVCSLFTKECCKRCGSS